MSLLKSGSSAYTKELSRQKFIENVSHLRNGSCGSRKKQSGLLQRGHSLELRAASAMRKSDAARIAAKRKRDSGEGYQKLKEQHQQMRKADAARIAAKWKRDSEEGYQKLQEQVGCGVAQNINNA